MLIKLYPKHIPHKTEWWSKEFLKFKIMKLKEWLKSPNRWVVPAMGLLMILLLIINSDEFIGEEHWLYIGIGFLVFVISVFIYKTWQHWQELK